MPGALRGATDRVRDAADGERRLGDLRDRVGGHDRARDVAARGRRHRQRRCADAAHDTVHRHRSADDAGAAHEHVARVEVERVARRSCTSPAHRGIPAHPVHALALPALTTTAEIGVPRRSVSCEMTTGAALTVLRVKTPAAAAGVSERITARSVRVSSPSPRIPAAATPPRKPSGAHTPARESCGDGRAHGHSTRDSSPAVSSNPNRMFMACTA